MTRIFVYASVLVAMLWCLPAHARLRGQARADSLMKELASAKEDTNKVNILCALLYSPYQWKNDDSGINMSLQAIALARKLEWKKGMARAYYSLGRCYRHLGNYPKALENALAALKYAQESGYVNAIAGYTEEVGTMYSHLSDNTTALEYYFRYQKLAAAMKDTDKLGRGNMAIADIFDEQKEYPKAMEYYNKAVALFQAVDNKRETAWAYGSISSIYKSMNESAKALEYGLRGLQLSEDIGFPFGIEYACKNISEVYADKKEYLLAVAYGLKCLDTCIRIGDNYYIASALCNLGNVYASLVDVNSMAGIGVNSGELPKGRYMPDATIPQSREARLRLATGYLQRALDTAKKVNALDVMQECYESLAKVYKQAHDFERAMDCYQNFVAIKDSVYSQKKASEITRMEMKRNIEEDSLKSAQARQVMEIKYKQQRNYTYLGIAGMLALLGFSFFIIKERGKSEKERKKSDDLLLNILPTEIAEELKINGSTTAKHYDHVTVLFTDFVNFTEAGERMSPQRLIDELHECFKMFDEITAKYSIEKIKTIGDAYLAVCGLPTADHKHAENVVRAAIEINAFMADRLAKMGSDRTFMIRIGIHTGSVVAGIVGVKKFAYDIWGDTVNTAARMEQNSEAGRINISETTYELVRDKFTCEYRGEVEAKGKGVMKMYFVTVNS